MSDCAYKLEGTVAISENKRDEFNRYILQLLDSCGIRKTEKMVLGGQVITVVRQPKPDEHGIVRFDYSIFEKKKRDVAEYDLNTCVLTVQDRGYDEFGVVMNMIMVMQEAYSEEHCYLMYHDNPCKIEGYAYLIKSVLGITLRFRHRERMWDMLCFLKRTGNYPDLTPRMILNSHSFDFCKLIDEQLFAAILIDSDELTTPRELFEGGKSEIKTARAGQLPYYVYQTIKPMIESGNEENVKAFLRKLLDADLQERQELAEEFNYGTIAEVSLYALPSIIVQGYAYAVSRKFWDAWEELGIKGYSEVIKEEENTKEEKKKEPEGYFPFYKAIRRDNEDEFIEFWKEKDLCLSDDMRECLSDWKENFTKTSLEDCDMETLLAQIITELDQEWGCRFVDQKFVLEFLEHQEDNNYRKALFFYRDFMNRDACYFPELTRMQAIRWVLRYNRRSFDFKAMGAFSSLLTNHRRRQEILGF
ncbi:MAG: hypothetical protein NC393_02630 [Clostridium sp.]|nr:hypothetical protein [Clostridium sp.]MCM1171001.1 hypothetical protein [Clostridium sp.]MCM1208021.1 hypothetical protein [Ruminococcus sp.]